MLMSSALQGKSADGRALERSCGTTSSPNASKADASGHRSAARGVPSVELASYLDFSVPLIESSQDIANLARELEKFADASSDMAAASFEAVKAASSQSKFLNHVQAQSCTLGDSNDLQLPKYPGPGAKEVQNPEKEARPHLAVMDLTGAGLS